MISRPAGFTLIELMMVVAMIAILAVIAAPSLSDIVRNARMTSAANDLLTDLSVARAEAVKRGSPTALCSSNNRTTCTATAWNQGWILFADPDSNGAVAAVADILKIAQAIDGAASVPPTTIVSTNPWVGFRPSGVVTAGGLGADITFTLCDGRPTTPMRGRLVTVSRTGRAFVARVTC